MSIHLLRDCRGNTAENGFSQVLPRALSVELGSSTMLRSFLTLYALIARAMREGNARGNAGNPRVNLC